MASFTMILWSRPKDIGIEGMTDIAYKMLKLLKDYGDELDPRYLTAMKKAAAREFVLNIDSVRVLIEKGIDKKALKLFNQMTSGISFFTSMIEDQSSGISIRIGKCDPMFSNSCVVNLPENFSGLSVRRDEFTTLFKQLIELFDPYYAFVENDSYTQPSRPFWLNNKPTYVHWMNYYNEKTAKTIGLRKVKSINCIERFAEGWYFKLQDEPIDANIPQHLQRQREVTKLLRL